MAGYYDRDAVDDFDEFDPEPYKGGYDQLVAYGKPIPPSDDTCYPLSTFSEQDDESHGFTYGSESCPYGGDCIDEDTPMHGTSASGRPQPQPAHDFDEEAEETPRFESHESYEGADDSYRKPYKPTYDEEPVPEPPRFERPDSYEGEEDSYRKPHRPSYTQEEEASSPRFEEASYRQDEGYERPEYGGEEYEEERRERPTYQERRNSYSEE